MDWTKTYAAHDSSDHRVYGARFSTEELRNRRSKGLCIRCGADGHHQPDCPYLPPRPENIKVSKVNVGLIQRMLESAKTANTGNDLLDLSADESEN